MSYIIHTKCDRLLQLGIKVVLHAPINAHPLFVLIKHTDRQTDKQTTVTLVRMRRALINTFHGQLNPLSSRSLIESCVMPVLMYGSEFWHLNTTLLSRLESFQAELGKRILRLPRTTATSIPLITLDWPSMRCRCLCAKLCFLSQACSGDSNTDTLREEVFKTLSYSDVEALDLVKQCRLLELPYSTNFTSEVLSN